ncbi:POK11 protein, partial [Orthonyx spaldingii]|nr:POK11 protein [Orthonyx spaldingii]
SPWDYLGLRIQEGSIVPQQFSIKDDPKTLHDLHQLCGSINWVRPLLGITSEDLAPLFNLMRGGEDLVSPRTITPDAQESICKVKKALSTCQAHKVHPTLPFSYIILGKSSRFHGLIFQWDVTVFLPHQPSKTITQPQELMARLVLRARTYLHTLAGCDFTCLYLPLVSEDLDGLLQTCEILQFALDSYTGQNSIHNPSHKLFNLAFNLVPKFLQSKTPLKALTVFTDGSGKSHKSVITWKKPKTQKWESDVEVVQGSPQIAELAAIVRTFERFKKPINLVTDSAYVASVVARAEHSLLKEVSNTNLYKLLSKLVHLLFHREHQFHVLHVRSHTGFPGFIAEGNRKADTLAMPVSKANLPDVLAQAKLSHQFFHQNVPALMRMFSLSWEQARAVVAVRPNCQRYQVPSISCRVNPRGLNSCQLRQTDVTHYPSFGRTKYLHVSIDTFSGAAFASARAGGKAKDFIKHFLHAFATLGVPEQGRRDNGPAYTSQKLANFFNQWRVKHTTGIPHSPTGQAMVERAHQNIK